MTSEITFLIYVKSEETRNVTQPYVVVDFAWSSDDTPKICYWIKFNYYVVFFESVNAQIFDQIWKVFYSSGQNKTR